MGILPFCVPFVVLVVIFFFFFLIGIVIEILESIHENDHDDNGPSGSEYNAPDNMSIYRARVESLKRMR